MLCSKRLPRLAARSPAKLSRPRLAAVHVVRRLLARLDKARHSPVAWIQGPPGAGKTTLVASYLKVRRVPSVWYRIDEGDGDVASFFHYVGLAVRRALPRARALPNFTPEYAAAVVPFARRFFREVWDRLGPRILVLDNYQDAPDPSGFHEVVQAAVSELPQGASLLVASRGGPPAALARLGVEGAISVLAGRELKLTKSEAAGLARARGVRLRPKAVEQLHAMTDGWAAGMVLLLASGHRMEGAGPERARQASANGVAAGTGAAGTGAAGTGELFDYFASEVFDRSPEPVRRLLLETALLPRILGETVEPLTGIAGARQMLASLARSGYFTVRLNQATEVYDYHPLFRQFLLQRGREVLDPERRDRLRAEAAVKLVATGETDSAVELLRAAGSWEELARLIVVQAPELAAAARLQTLASWIQSLPQELRDREPWLLYWLGQTIIAAAPESARQHLEAAYQLFWERGDAAGAYLAWSSITSTYVFHWSDFRPLDRWIEVFAELRRRWPEAPTPAIEASAVGGMFTALAFRQPGHPDMESWRERARAVVLGREDIRLRRLVGAALAQFENWRGCYAETCAVLEAIAPSAAEARDDPASAVYCLVGWAGTEVLGGHPTEALQAVNEGLAIAQQSGLRQWITLLQVPAVWSYLALDDLDGARGALRAIEASMDKRLPMLTATYETLASLVARRAGEQSKAIRHAQRGIDLATAGGGPNWLGLAQGALAAAELDGGKPERARAIARGEPYAHPPCWVLATCPIAGLAAFDALRRGEEELAATFLDTSFGMGAARGMIASTVLSRPQLAELCAFALRRGIQPEHARNVIACHALTPPDGATAAWPWKVRVRTLGAFHVEVDGRTLSFGRKSPRKPIELLKALIAFGSAKVPEGRVADALWPEAEGDAARHALETTVYRLRKLLPDVVLQRDRHLSLDRGQCWVDIHVIEDFLSRISTAAGALRRGQDALPELAQEALDLCQGPFLPDDEHPWVAHARQHKHDVIRRFLASVARWLPHREYEARDFANRLRAERTELV